MAYCHNERLSFLSYKIVSIGAAIAVCSGTSNNNGFADFELSIVKNCDFYQKFQHKNESPILPPHSVISYKPTDNTVHP